MRLYNAASLNQGSWMDSSLQTGVKDLGVVSAFPFFFHFLLLAALAFFVLVARLGFCCSLA
jgi:hypothetical protein